jgi:hypothetical protein
MGCYENYVFYEFLGGNVMKVNVKEKTRNVWTWTKNHWVDIACTGCMFVVTGGLVYAAKKISEPITFETPNIDTLEPGKVHHFGCNEMEVLRIPDKLCKYVNEISSDAGVEWKDVWMDEIPFEDLGKFGEALKEIPGIENYKQCINGGVTTLCKKAE